MSMTSTRWDEGLQTRRGFLSFPAYIPVTTFGQRYPLDEIIRPYLSRFAKAWMVSHYYMQFMPEGTHIPLPLLVDSGGFASLFEDARILKRNGLGVIERQLDEDVQRVAPNEVLARQEEIADIAFTLDFPVPPKMTKKEAHRRLDLTIANAHWALAHRRSKEMKLYACVQAWDRESAQTCANAYAGHAFDGIAIGGLVPRSRDVDLIEQIVTAVRECVPNKPIHVFGLGRPRLVASLFEWGVQSVDSSAYVKMAADGRLWSDPTRRFDSISPTERLHLALCNLATACQTTLPLSFAEGLFQTPSLDRLRQQEDVSLDEDV